MDNVQKTFYKVADFISWMKKGGLELSPFFQRKSVWDNGSKSYLIDTIYRDLPIPIIFLRDRGIDKNSFEPIREVVDGQQRLRTIISFISSSLLKDYNPERDSFLVKKTHNKDLAGLTFSQLPTEIQDKILNYTFDVHIFPSSVDDRDIIQIFRRMNSTNFTLNKQEERNSQYFGEFKTSQYLLAAEQLNRWRGWQTFTENELARMEEVELTSELSIAIFEEKVKGKSQSNLKKYYLEFDDRFPYRQEVEDRFRKTMEFIENNFEGNKLNYIFFGKRLFYVFFLACYVLIYGTKSHTKTKGRATKEAVLKFKRKSEYIRARKAPLKVLEATDRRTTNVKEREILFQYLLAK